MSRFLAFIVAGLLLSATLPQAAWAADAEMREQFDEIVAALNDNKFSEFQDAINERDLLNRIYGTRVINPDVREAFAESFETELRNRGLNRELHRMFDNLAGRTTAFTGSGGGSGCWPPSISGRMRLPGGGKQPHPPREGGSIS